MGLIGRLYLLVILAVAPAMAILIYDEVQLRQTREAAVHDEALRYARLISSEMDRTIEGIRNLLLAVAHAPPVRAQTEEACSAYVKELGEQYDNLVAIAALDAEGRPFCLDNEFKPGESAMDRPFFRRALAEEGFVIGEYTVGRSVPARMLTFATTFKDYEGQTAGVVATGLDLDWLRARLATNEFPPGTTVTLADPDGTILVRLPTQQLEGKAVPERMLRRIATSEGGTFRLPAEESPDGVSRIVGFSPPDEPSGSLLVAVGLAEDWAVAAERAATWRSLTLLGLSAILALAAAGVIGRLAILQPIAALLRTADRWRAGDFSVRAGLSPRAAELGRLGAAFDDMAAVLQDRDAEISRMLQALSQSEQRFRTLANTVPDIVWTAAPDGAITFANDRWFEYCGITREENVRNWPEVVLHPDDRERCLDQWARALHEGTEYEIEVRNRRHDGEYRWFLTRAVPIRDAAGCIVAWFGSTTDIQDRKLAEERLQLLANELSHRVKNVLATVQALAGQSFRNADSLEKAAESFGARLRNLARSHDLLTATKWRGAGVRQVVMEAIAPFQDERTARIGLEGPDVHLEPQAALALSMAFHELATNAAKYGALSGPTGRVEVSWSLESVEREMVRLQWTETGGPAVEKPERHGFGSLLIERALAQELDGEVTIDFAPAGVRCVIVFPIQQRHETAAA